MFTAQDIKVQDMKMQEDMKFQDCSYMTSHWPLTIHALLFCRLSHSLVKSIGSRMSRELLMVVWSISLE